MQRGGGCCTVGTCCFPPCSHPVIIHNPGWTTVLFRSDGLKSICWHIGLRSAWPGFFAAHPDHTWRRHWWHGGITPEHATRWKTCRKWANAAWEGLRAMRHSPPSPYWLYCCQERCRAQLNWEGGCCRALLTGGGGRCREKSLHRSQVQLCRQECRLVYLHKYQLFCLQNELIFLGKLGITTINFSAPQMLW